MIKLRSKLTALLKPHLPNVVIDSKSKSRVHYQTAPANTPMPYLIYNFLPSFTNDEQEVIPLDIDIWDNNTDTTDIETLASTLWKEFRNFRYIDENMQITIHRESRMPELDEAEIGIRRRKLTFQVRYFDRTL